MAQPKFIPAKGQVDYTNIRYCPVTNCVVKHKDKILLVKRSNDLNLYPGFWNGISGFLDDNKIVEDKVKEELFEELNISKDKVLSIKRGKVLVQESEEYRKTWIVFPVLVEVRSDLIELDWEASDHRWVSEAQARKMKLLPGFSEVLDALLP